MRKEGGGVPLGLARASDNPEAVLDVRVVNDKDGDPQDQVVTESENIAIAAPSVTRYIDLSKYARGITIQVKIVGAGLTVKLFLTNEPGTDLTALEYRQLTGSYADLTATGEWNVTENLRALKIEIDSTVATDDAYIYASKR